MKTRYGVSSNERRFLKSERSRKLSDINYIRDGRFVFDWQVGTENSVFFGAHWNGKTFTCTNLIVRPLLGVYDQLIWDHKGHIVQELFSRRMTPDQEKIASSGLVIQASQLRQGTCIMRPRDKTLKHFEEFCATANKAHDLHVVIDETKHYNSAHSIPPAFSELVTEKGNDNVSYTCIFQRPAENHKSLISNAQHRFCFSLTVPTDVVYLRSLIGPEVELFLPVGSPLRRFYKEEPRLPLRSFIYRDEKAERPVVVVGGLKLK